MPSMSVAAGVDGIETVEAAAAAAAARQARRRRRSSAALTPPSASSSSKTCRGVCPAPAPTKVHFHQAFAVKLKTFLPSALRLPIVYGPPHNHSLRLWVHDQSAGQVREGQGAIWLRCHCSSKDFSAVHEVP